MAELYDEIVKGKYFKFEIDGTLPPQFTNQPAETAPLVIPGAGFLDADGTLQPAPSTGTESGVLSAGSSSWHDGNALQFMLEIESPHTFPVDRLLFYDQTSPGGPTDWFLRINGDVVAGGPTHSNFNLNVQPFPLRLLEGPNLIEIVGTGATDSAAIWAVDDVAIGHFVPEPSGLALATAAVGSFVFGRWLRRPSRKRPTAKSRSKRPLRLAVLLSGEGIGLSNLAAQIQRGALDAQIALVVSSRRHAAGVQQARQLGLPVRVVSRSDYDSKSSYSRAIFDLAREHKSDLVCMAGFLPILEIPADHAGRVLNIHPSLLPEFGGRGMYGMHVHEAVLASGARETGSTVHYCDDEIDHGPIVLQRRCPVRPGDTPRSLALRVFQLGCLMYPRAIKLAGASIV